MAELTVDRVAPVLTLTLQRPERMNALTTGLRRELLAAVDAAARDREVRAVVLTGAGRAFCAGQDLAELSALGSELSVTTVLRESYHPLIAALTMLRKPVICALNGPCAGAGLGLALACDLRLMADEAFLACAFAGIGLAPDSGTTSLLVRAVGYERALELAATGRRVDAAEARALGLVLETAPGAQLAARAQALAEQLAAGPALAIAETKRLLREARDRSLSEMLELEAEAQGALAGSADHREGIAAFVAKRPPAFRGE